MTTRPDNPQKPPDVQMDGAAREQGSVYQAAHDQTITQIIQQGTQRPLPQVDAVQVPPGLSGLPRRPAAAFIGRDAALTALRQTLRDTTGTGVISQAVVGLGGVGKSELALQYAYHHRQEYRLVWWIDADGPDLIRAGLVALARALTCGIDSVAAEQATAEEASAWALSWLSTQAGWLIIFDNVEEVADIEPYLARLTHGHVLITTRRDVGWQQLHTTPLRLDLLPRPASITLLSDLIGPPGNANASGLGELAEWLGDLPLALTQAGAYITRTPRMSLTRYLDLLKTSPARMYAAAPAGGDVERVVARVWMLSQARIHAVSPLAGNLLNVLACFAPDNLPCTVLTGFHDADELQVDEALALLASYSLITLTTSLGQGLTPAHSEDLVSVHRLIQAVTLSQLTPTQRDSVRHNAADLLLAVLREDPGNPSNWSVYRSLLPHARIVLPLDSAGLRQVVDYLSASGDYTAAVHLQQQIHTHATSTLGVDHPHTLAARHNLASCTGQAGDAAAARDQLAALLPVRERVLGAEHPHTLSTRHYLADWTGQAGDAAAARDQLAALLPVRERVLGAEHPHTLITRHYLADWTGQAGDAAAARDQLAALLPIHERVNCAEHPHVQIPQHYLILMARHFLADWTGKAGDAAAARDQLAALLPIHERVDGAEHPHTLNARNMLANWTGQAGDAAAARDQLAALLPVRERVLGAEHPHTLITRHYLADWTGQAGDAAAARDQLAALLPIHERVDGAEHPHTLNARNMLANWIGQAGDAAAARDQLAALLPLQERVLGAEHPHILITRHLLANWTGQAGDAAAARDQLTALLPLQERVLGAEHPHIPNAKGLLAFWTEQAGDAGSSGG
ncbi:tetratricopeptide repeat protein [Nonomuraea sp. NPDC049758]|uniref:tetratricopeptide repeat protein n=1 Tax=Nonomuraea sp. NPDC049758 TaxID=3154360 RepID=UPI003432055D